MHEAITTGLLYIATNKGIVETIVDKRAIVGVHFNFTKKKFRLAFNFNISTNAFDVGDTILQSIFTLTNDPYTKHTGALISLGYYGFRFHVTKAQVLSTKPYIIETDDIDNFKVSCVTPVRQIHNFLKYKDSVRGFNITKEVNGSINMHYLFNQDHSTPFPVVVSSFDKEKLGDTFVALINPMSYYQTVGIVNQKKYKTQKNQELAHKKIVKEILVGDK